MLLIILKPKIKENAAIVAATTLTTNDSGKKKKKKKEKEKDKKNDDDEVTEKSVESSPNVSKPASIQPSTQPQLIQEIQKPISKSSSHNTPIIVSTPSMPVVIAPVIPISTPSATVDGDVKSRDDLLSYLLTMGFPESECLAAISSCGLNVDDAISWLCDRPNGLSNHAPGKTKSNISETKEIKKVPNGKPPQPPSTLQETDIQLKYQKDKEHKEEQRRINRAWNARVPQQRAEEERKKV